MFHITFLESFDNKLIEAVGRLLHIQATEMANHGQANQQAWFLPLRLGGYHQSGAGVGVGMLRGVLYALLTLLGGPYVLY